MNNIGENIKAARKKCGMTQEQLAEQLHTTKAAISRYELNQRAPKLEMLEKIAKATGVYVCDLVGNDFWGHLTEYENAASCEDDSTKELALSLLSALNESGQQRAIEYLEMLVDSEKYKRMEK